MGKYKHLLIAGHGGLNEDGVYTTCPNWDINDRKTWHKMHVHNGVPVFEGVCNRQIALKIEKLCQLEGIAVEFLNPGYEDISLRKRCDLVNIRQATSHNCIAHFIHGNAFNTAANGFEIFTTPGETKSDPIAQIIFEEIQKAIPEFKMRADWSDGDADKEARFYVLKHTSTPAVLSEMGFFDHPKEYKLFAEEEGQTRIAEAYVAAIKRIETLL